MTLTASRSPVEMMEHQYTVADLAELPAELPSGPVRWELDNGRLVSIAPPGDEHGAVELKIAGALLLPGRNAWIWKSTRWGRRRGPLA